MMTCRHASRLVSDALDRRLSWWERARLGLHLAGCRACRHFRRAAAMLCAALAAPPSAVPLPADAHARIAQALARAQAAEE